MLALTETLAARLHAVSFFLAVMLLSAAVVQWLWNLLRTDFPRFPRLSYGRSLAMVGLWGLLFRVVMTMIATTREFMEPGSWHKQGLLYQASTQAMQQDAGSRAEKQP